MKQRKRRQFLRTAAFSLGVAILVSGVLVSSPSNAGQRLESGTSVILFLEASGNQPEPDPGPPTDMLIFTGGRTFSIELHGCSETSLPVQNAVLVDANGPRSSRTVSAFVMPVFVSGGLFFGLPSGTRLTGFQPAGSCISGGIRYRKYSTTVE